MNPERKVCSCGAATDAGSHTCAACGSALSSADADETFPPGTILGSYRLVRQIGSGGMGRVFVAEHTRLGRQVALKLLRSEYSGNREAVKRFFAEARAVNRINHENIIEISDFVENVDGAYYIMELLKGVDLRTLRERSNGPLPLPRTLGIAIQVCAGLGAAHRAGIVHRDLKPDNIFLTERGGKSDFVKLLDFGVAKLMDATLDDASMVKSTAGVVVGTPDYMSPEQAIGESVDARSDVYALGVILFEMVADQRPFEAQSAREIMVKHLVTPPPRVTKVSRIADAMPPALEQLVMACLQKDPGQRPQTVKEVEDRLRRILESIPQADTAAATITGASWALQRLATDRRVWIAGVAVMMVLAGVVALIATGRRTGRGDSRAAAIPSGAAVTDSTSAPTSAEAEPGRPPAPAMVELSFSTTPPGAAVFRVGTETPLGLTPFVARVPASPRPQPFEFRLNGWKVARKDVALQTNTRVELALVPEDGEDIGTRRSDRSSARGGKRRKHEQREQREQLDQSTVLNPFE